MKSLPARLRGLPTPMAGLALGTASLGWALENALPLAGWGQIAGAALAAFLLGLLIFRFVLHPQTLWADIKHPVTGSIVPTFAMALMVISRALLPALPGIAVKLWCLAVALHVCALVLFVVFRFQEAVMPNMVPSWFIPPVGLIVADVSFPGIPELLPLAHGLLAVGLICYAVLLPVMLYRLILLPQIAQAAKPTLAIMAAPASLSLAGYLTVMEAPNLLIVSVLLGIALLMTLVIYFCFWQLLRLKFTPGFAAFTFPLVIGATALYKLSELFEHLAGTFPGALEYAADVRLLAHIELGVAAVVVTYVFVLYMKNLRGFLAVR